MIELDSEPVIRVGLMSHGSEARVTLAGQYVLDGGELVEAGDYLVRADSGTIKVNGLSNTISHSLKLSPLDFNSCQVTVHAVTIGVDFHWQRQESQSLQGALRLVADEKGITVINELPLESYLVSVISSEMSASCPAELLRAHAIVSRSWLLAQLSVSDLARQPQTPQTKSAEEIIRWYDREAHPNFDVCADDHCQRYQGISKAFSREAFEAVRDTRGRVIVWRDEICDARYSKSCGGMTEVYSAAWEDKDVPYLKAIYDGSEDLGSNGGTPFSYPLPLSDESNARRWITSSPKAYCQMASGELLARILPGFDQETRDFYRWEVEYTQEELAEIVRARLGVDLGRILALEPVARGESGRLVRLRIRGEKQSVIIGKELEIRRALSRSHLYSSAFVVVPEGAGEYPSRFKLAGAGWGHGVGLCQIGAAVMADLGFTHEQILSHYFNQVTLQTLY